PVIPRTTASGPLRSWFANTSKALAPCPSLTEFAVRLVPSAIVASRPSRMLLTSSLPPTLPPIFADVPTRALRATKNVGVLTHVPLDGSQLSIPLHASPSSQPFGV